MSQTWALGSNHQIIQNSSFNGLERIPCAVNSFHPPKMMTFKSWFYIIRKLWSFLQMCLKGTVDTIFQKGNGTIKLVKWTIVYRNLWVSGAKKMECQLLVLADRFPGHHNSDQSFTQSSSIFVAGARLCFISEIESISPFAQNKYNKLTDGTPNGRGLEDNFFPFQWGHTLRFHPWEPTFPSFSRGYNYHISRD